MSGEVEAIEPTVFEHAIGWSVRSAVVAGLPVFVARDVCEAVGLTKYRDAVAQLDADERVSVAVDTPGGVQQMAAVTEAGVFSLMLISRSTKVRAFKRWLTHEVLPQINHTGSYAPQVALPGPRELAAMVIAEADRADAAEQRAISAEAVARDLHPAAKAWESIADADGDMSLRDAAQMLARAGVVTGQNRLAKQLRDIGWCDRNGRPYQSQVDTGRLVVRMRSFPHPTTGEDMVRPQTRVTAKGIERLLDLLGDPA